MQIDIHIQSAPVLSVKDIPSLLGIVCPDGLPGRAPIKGIPGISWTFPGAAPLTASQQAGLELLTEYLVTGQERYPGLIQFIVDAGDFVIGKRNFLKSQIDAPDASSPIQSMLLLLVLISSGVENITAAKAEAKTLIDSGAVD